MTPQIVTYLNQYQASLDASARISEQGDMAAYYRNCILARESIIARVQRDQAHYLICDIRFVRKLGNVFWRLPIGETQINDDTVFLGRGQFINDLCGSIERAFFEQGGLDEVHICLEPLAAAIEQHINTGTALSFLRDFVRANPDIISMRRYRSFLSWIETAFSDAGISISEFNSLCADARYYPTIPAMRQYTRARSGCLIATRENQVRNNTPREPVEWNSPVLLARREENFSEMPSGEMVVDLRLNLQNQAEDELLQILREQRQPVYMAVDPASGEETQVLSMGVQGPDIPQDILDSSFVGLEGLVIRHDGNLGFAIRMPREEHENRVREGRAGIHPTDHITLGGYTCRILQLSMSERITDYTVLFEGTAAPLDNRGLNESLFATARQYSAAIGDTINPAQQAMQAMQDLETAMIKDNDKNQKLLALLKKHRDDVLVVKWRGRNRLGYPPGQEIWVRSGNPIHYLLPVFKTDRSALKQNRLNNPNNPQGCSIYYTDVVFARVPSADEFAQMSKVKNARRQMRLKDN